VTGGSSGIGEAIARRLTADGWRCILVARRRERLERVAARLGAEAEPCDVGDRAEVEDLAGRVGERHPAIRLLVNNAGIPGGGGFLDLPADGIEELVRINYLGSVWCLRAFLPLLEAAAPSDVVNVTSIAGTVAYGSSGPYSASKHAQLAFSRNVAAEVAPLGIRVHAVNPGPVATEGFPQRRLLAVPLARLRVVRPERVGDAVVRAVARGIPEVTVVRPYRLASIAQALVPGTLARVTASRRKAR
jgi:NAD(P)-dependent dehydrogenase (short-subunit alcohol dehydrogenase family)